MVQSAEKTLEEIRDRIGILVDDLTLAQAEIVTLTAGLAALDGAHRSSNLTYIGPTIVGTDNTAMDLHSILMPANYLTQVGDRIRLRCYFQATTGAAISGITKVNGIHCAHSSILGTTESLTETWLHYRDATHANICESGAYPSLGPDAAPDVAGFDWAAPQLVTFEQTAAVGNHLLFYACIVDRMPKGVN